MGRKRGYGKCYKSRYQLQVERQLTCKQQTKAHWPGISDGSRNSDQRNTSWKFFRSGLADQKSKGRSSELPQRNFMRTDVLSGFESSPIRGLEVSYHLSSFFLVDCVWTALLPDLLAWWASCSYNWALLWERGAERSEAQRPACLRYWGPRLTWHDSWANWQLLLCDVLRVSGAEQHIQLTMMALSKGRH